MTSLIREYNSKSEMYFVPIVNSSLSKIVRKANKLYFSSWIESYLKETALLLPYAERIDIHLQNYLLLFTIFFKI
jgi:hypothetical protein